jgi:hypothetical protein
MSKDFLLSAALKKIGEYESWRQQINPANWDDCLESLRKISFFDTEQMTSKVNETSTTPSRFETTKTTFDVHSPIQTPPSSQAKESFGIFQKFSNFIASAPYVPSPQKSMVKKTSFDMRSCPDPSQQRKSFVKNGSFDSRNSPETTQAVPTLSQRSPIFFALPVAFQTPNISSVSPFYPNKLLDPNNTPTIPPPPQSKTEPNLQDPSLHLSPCWSLNRNNATPDLEISAHDVLNSKIYSSTEILPLSESPISPPAPFLKKSLVPLLPEQAAVLIQAFTRRWLAVREITLSRKIDMILGELMIAQEESHKLISCLYENYYTPLMQKNKILTKNDAQILFSSLSSIYTYSQSFLCELQSKRIISKVLKHPFQNLQGLFSSFFYSSSSYRTYAEAAVTALIQNCYLREKPDFVQFIAKQDKATSCQFENLLSAPLSQIIRIQQVALELDQLLPGKHPNKGEISHSLAKLRQMVEYIQLKQKDCTEITKVINIFLSLHPQIKDFLLPTRRLLKIGRLNYTQKHGESVEKHIFLFNDVMLVTRKSVTVSRSINGTKTGDQYLLEIYISMEKLIKITPLLDDETTSNGGFVLESMRKTLIFHCIDKDQAEWVDLITNNIN